MFPLMMLILKVIVLLHVQHKALMLVLLQNHPKNSLNTKAKQGNTTIMVAARVDVFGNFLFLTASNSTNFIIQNLRPMLLHSSELLSIAVL